MQIPIYYRHIRNDIERFLPDNFDCVLEVGCGAGKTLEWLKENYRCSKTIGVELNTLAANEASKRVDHVICGNIESLDLGIVQDSIDLVLCLDVLEHLVDPWTVVKNLKKKLKDGGTLIACIPNTRNFHVTFPLLLKGEWGYTEDNFLDKTHLRFFTKKTAVELFTNAGMHVEYIFGTGFEKWTKSRIVNALTFGLLRGIFEYEYIIVAKK